MSSHDSNRPLREKIRHLGAQAWIEIRYGYRLYVTINRLWTAAERLLSALDWLSQMIQMIIIHT